jgi:hypothetical protein
VTIRRHMRSFRIRSCRRLVRPASMDRNFQ